MKVKRTDPNIIQTKTEDRPSYTNRQNGKYYVIKLIFKNVSMIRLFYHFRYEKSARYISLSFHNMVE